jgi:hypothetical protein
MVWDVKSIKGGGSQRELNNVMYSAYLSWLNETYVIDAAEKNKFSSSTTTTTTAATATSSFTPLFGVNKVKVDLFSPTPPSSASQGSDSRSVVVESSVGVKTPICEGVKEQPTWTEKRSSQVSSASTSEQWARKFSAMGKK